MFRTILRLRDAIELEYSKNVSYMPACSWRPLQDRLTPYLGRLQSQQEKTKLHGKDAPRSACYTKGDERHSLTRTW